MLVCFFLADMTHRQLEPKMSLGDDDVMLMMDGWMNLAVQAQQIIINNVTIIGWFWLR